MKKLNLYRDGKTIREASSESHVYKVFVAVKSKAGTLDGINAAIGREIALDPGEKWFEDVEALERTNAERFISFHKDGFIIWYDGD